VSAANKPASATHPLIDTSDEVGRALAAGGPVVALESTIISHGMPYPENLSTAREVEQIVRDHGAIPATIALVDGRLRVGLDDTALDRLAKPGDVVKASRRDLAALVASGATAGTTVAATMYIASLCGVAVFATGGIGGVHRGAEDTFDISADLFELGGTPVTVVCAGAKSILDLPKTLEVLETHGVPVIGVGTDEFPAFFTRSSGLPVAHRVDSAAELARLVSVQRALGLDGGVLVAVPIPAADAMEVDEINAIIERALNDADRHAISGKDVTPYLLARINELTDGRSLAANVALIRNNAAFAADLAVARTQL
jgi:pseudouridine-5'-phosphate glycosidase